MFGSGQPLDLASHMTALLISNEKWMISCK